MLGGETGTSWAGWVKACIWEACGQESLEQEVLTPSPGESHCFWPRGAKYLLLAEGNSNKDLVGKDNPYQSL